MSEKQSTQMAFPYVSSGGRLFSEGMTLRDYFAAKAMQAYCSRQDWTDDMAIKETANCAYSVADAMLEARK